MEFRLRKSNDCGVERDVVAAHHRARLRDPWLIPDQLLERRYVATELHCLEGVASVADVEDDEVSAERVQGNGNCPLFSQRHVLWNAVFRRDDGAVRDGQH